MPCMITITILYLIIAFPLALQGFQALGLPIFGGKVPGASVTEVRNHSHLSRGLRKASILKSQRLTMKRAADRIKSN
jgi:hypothetical protein